MAAAAEAGGRAGGGRGRGPVAAATAESKAAAAAGEADGLRGRGYGRPAAEATAYSLPVTKRFDTRGFRLSCLLTTVDNYLYCTLLAEGMCARGNVTQYSLSRTRILSAYLRPPPISSHASKMATGSSLGRPTRRGKVPPTFLLVLACRYSIWDVLHRMVPNTSIDPNSESRMNDMVLCELPVLLSNGDGLSSARTSSLGLHDFIGIRPLSWRHFSPLLFDWEGHVLLV